MVDLLKFTFNKKTLNRVVALVLAKFVAKFCPKFNYVGPKKNLGWSQSFFKDKKKSQIFKIYT